MATVAVNLADFTVAVKIATAESKS